VGFLPLPLAFAPELGFFFGGTVPLASAVPSVAVDAFLVGFAGGGGFMSFFSYFFSTLAFSSLAEPISRSAVTAVTMPDRNMTSCVKIRIAEDTTI
jgi:hypothetical protein